MKITRLLILALSVVALAATCARADEGTRVVELNDDGRALINPYMGWTMHYYSNIPYNYGWDLEPSDSLEWFEGCSVIYLRLPWSYIEPEEGVFNWSIVDTPAQRWIEKGKQVAFRFTTSENWVEYATPKWVFDAGAKGVRYDWGEPFKEDGKYVDPEFDDPIYLEKLENFLKAAGERYGNNPNVAFIDVGTYGMWGEGHSTLGVWDGRLSELAGSQVAPGSRYTPERTFNIVKTHIALHKKYFPNVQLCVSDDVAGPSKPGDSLPELDYALENGVSFRDDSILVGQVSWYHEAAAQKFWPTMPVILEHEHMKPSIERGCWDNDKLLRSVEAHHASYMSIHWTPEEEKEQLGDTLRQINMRIGYRLLPSRVEYPATVKIDEFFDVKWTLENRGVAPCYHGGFVALTLKDEKGGIVSLLVDESFDVRDLPVGEPGAAPKIERAAKFRVGHVAPSTKPGTYQVYVSIGTRDGTPVYELPLGDSDGAKRYRIGEITIE